VNEKISSFAESVLKGRLLDRQEIIYLLGQSEGALADLLYWASKIREYYFGNKIKACSIVSGRLGGCDQDCKFCAQSARYKTHIGKAQTASDAEILEAARQAKDSGISNFGIVYSGKSISEDECTRLAGLIEKIRSDFGLGLCASLGIITAQQAERLVRAGLSRYNHNLETSRRFFPSIVTTHKYSDRVETIKVAMSAGLGICAGGIFGLGEIDRDRIEMALELRGLGVDTVPMTFLHPIEGTPFANATVLSPREILRIIALYRFILPRTNLKIAGGRVLLLRDMQSWMFYAGATGILTGNYLTTTGRAACEDKQMLKDLGLELSGA